MQSRLILGAALVLLGAAPVAAQQTGHGSVGVTDVIRHAAPAGPASRGLVGLDDVKRLGIHPEPSARLESTTHTQVRVQDQQAVKEVP